MTAGEIFVVDDDASVRRALDRLLRSAGYGVRTFASAGDVMAAMRSDRPACLVVDVRMPECTGLELADTLRREPDPPAVIFITGHGDVAMAERAMERGALDFLPKPFDDSVLLDAIAQAVRKTARS
jgi:FixJ family two-component response regulator